MLSFFRTTPRVRPSTGLRSFLRLEELGCRATPSTLPVDPPPPNPPVIGPPAPAVAPVIDTFISEGVARGWYEFSGHVTNATAGMIVTFGGVPSLMGKTAVVQADGTFSLLVQVKTDGSDRGTVTAQTVNAAGMLSNLAVCEISPTH